MQAVAPFKEAADIIKEEGGEILKLCYQCGVCSATCPWNLVRSFIVRRIMHEAQLGLVDLEADEMWLCTSCKACVQRCPLKLMRCGCVLAVKLVSSGVPVVWK